MHKFLRRLVSVLFVLSTIVGITSCLPESEPIVPFTLAVWTAHKAVDQQLYFIADDDSTTFVPRTTLAYPDSLLGKRCYVEFTLSTQQKLGYTYVIDVNYIQYVPMWSMVDIHTESQSDSLGHDPSELALVWVSGNYLNVMYRYYGTGTIKHSFTLARNCFIPETAPDSVINLEFLHNNKNDNAGREYLNVVSYDISDLAASRTTDFYLNIKYRTFNLYFNTVKIKVPIAEVKQLAPFYLTPPSRSLSQWGE